MNESTFLITFNVIATIFIVVLNARYFWEVKTKWRWIKFIYTINSIIVFVVLFQALIHREIHADLLLVATTILIVTILAGTIVSFAKLNLVNFLKRIDEEEQNMSQ